MVPARHARAEVRYQRGFLIDATAWEDDGTPRPKPEAEAQAAADEISDKRLFAVLETLIYNHSPHCD